MENNGPTVPTCVLKVNLQCCDACPCIVKKQLKKINGVTDIRIDTKEGLVKVSGVADASILINAIKKVGRKAMLCKFEMQPKDQPDPSCNCKDTHYSKAKHMKGKHNHDDDHSDTCSCCDDDGDDVNAPHFKDHAALGSSVADSGYHYPQIAMQGGHGSYFPRPVIPYTHARPYNYQCAPPMVYGRPQQPHPHNYYQQRPPQARVLLPHSYHGELKYGDTDGAVGNNLAHTFNDMNVNGCTIT